MNDFSEKINLLKKEIDSVIVGQENLKRDIQIALFSWGHILLEWAPGLAKTRTAKVFSEAMNLDFQRIQFTPDLLPSDLIGAKIYDPDAKEFRVKKWPIFWNFILADEINRAPSKVQSALLEAMEEKQVTIGEESFQLGDPFLVIATQNPIEQEGTFSLPEAQLDRFLLKSIIEYPSPDEEIEIMQNMLTREKVKVKKILSKRDIAEIKKQIEEVQVSDWVYSYIRDIIFATRSKKYKQTLFYGASPRASLALVRTAKTLAFLNGRDFVLPEDIKEMVYPVLRHRLIVSFESLANGIESDDIIWNILWEISIS